MDYRTEFEDGTENRRFEVEIEGAAASTTYDVSVAGTVVGQITTDADGDGELELKTTPEDADEQPFPAGFVTPQAGDTIDVGGIVSGTVS